MRIFLLKLPIWKLFLTLQIRPSGKTTLQNPVRALSSFLLRLTMPDRCIQNAAFEPALSTEQRHDPGNYTVNIIQ